MKATDETQLLPKPLWSDPRTHLLDDTWLLSIFAILVAIVLPWLISGFDVNLGAAALGLLALGGIHVGLTSLSDPARPPLPGQRRLRILLHAAGILAMTFVWHHAGGLQNPALLVVFALPVIASIFLSRWQPYLMTLLAIAAVAFAALIEAPELRWYLGGISDTGAWLAGVLGGNSAVRGAPFPGFYAPATYYLVMLQVFAVLLFASAVAAEYLGTVLDRLQAGLSGARAEAERAQELWITLIENFPQPALLVDADSLQIICASRHVAAVFSTEEDLTGRKLTEALRFSYPEVVQDLVTGTGGFSPVNMIRTTDRMYAAEIHVQHVAQRGRRFALVIIRDTTRDLCIRAALDMADYAALVLDGRGRILAYNKAAAGLFPGTAPGADASNLLVQPGSTGPWWQPGLSGRRKMHVEIQQRVYQVTSAAVALPGEEERIFAVAFLPIARAAATDQTGVLPTLPSTLGQRQ